MDRQFCYLNYYSKHYDKCKFALKLIRLITVSNLFPLEFEQNANFAYYGKTRKPTDSDNHMSFCVQQKTVSIISINIVM